MRPPAGSGAAAADETGTGLPERQSRGERRRGWGLGRGQLVPPGAGQGWGGGGPGGGTPQLLPRAAHVLRKPLGLGLGLSCPAGTPHPRRQRFGAGFGGKRLYCSKTPSALKPVVVQDFRGAWVGREPELVVGLGGGGFGGAGAPRAAGTTWEARRGALIPKSCCAS